MSRFLELCQITVSTKMKGALNNQQGELVQVGDYLFLALNEVDYFITISFLAAPKSLLDSLWATLPLGEIQKK